MCQRRLTSHYVECLQVLVRPIHGQKKSSSNQDVYFRVRNKATNKQNYFFSILCDRLLFLLLPVRLSYDILNANKFKMYLSGFFAESFPGEVP